MPKKHPNTVRWGGPGANHEDATKPIPKPDPAHPDGAVSTNPRVSTRSCGGGERDEKHSHVDPMRSSKSHATDTIGADAGHLRGGRGVAPDEPKAVYWYRRAAEQRHAPAQNNLGVMLENDRGTPPNLEEAVMWYQRAARQNRLLAQEHLRRLNRSW